MKPIKNVVLFSLLSLVMLSIPQIGWAQDYSQYPQQAGQQPPVYGQPPPAPAAPPPAEPADPMGHFNLTPKIGYAYLGGQGATATNGAASASGDGYDINAMQVGLDFRFGSTQFGPFYMLLKPDAPGDITMHALGIDTGYLFSWNIPVGGGTIYPGVGVTWKIAWLFADTIDYGAFSALRIPVSCTWYFSNTVPIGLMLEVGLGFQTNMTNPASSDVWIFQYGFYTDVTLGFRFL